MAKWIGKAIKHPGRTRRMLGLKAGQQVTVSAVEKKKASLRKAGKLDRSASSALSLAERFASGNIGKRRLKVKVRRVRRR
jgi:hypothetical protein